MSEPNKLKDDAFLIDALDRSADAMTTGMIIRAKFEPTREFVQMLEQTRDRLREMTQFQPIETAPHNRSVLLGWRDWRDGKWLMAVDAATTGERFDNGYSSVSQHGSATHWMHLPPPPPTESED